MSQNVIIGVGTVNLDEHIVTTPAHKSYTECEVGGTCGNVLSLLAHYGWRSVPFLYLDNSETGQSILKHLLNEGIDVSCVKISQDTDSVRVTFRHEVPYKDETKKVNKCSGKGKQQIIRKLPTSVEIIDYLKKNAGQIIPNCFFSDRLFPGIQIVQDSLPKETVFYYEPNHIKDLVSQHNILEKCTVIKFSAERISPHFFDKIEFPNNIIICTKGGVEFL